MEPQGSFFFIFSPPRIGYHGMHINTVRDSNRSVFAGVSLSF